MNCILNPPGPRNTKYLNGCRKAMKKRAQPLENGSTTKRYRLNGATKLNSNAQLESVAKLKCDKTVSNDIIQNGYEEISNVSCILQGRAQSIKQKVKYIPQNQFVHIKPPPINTQKIYVKQQNGNQSYTLGVKNIGKIEATQCNLPTMKNKNQYDTQFAIPKNTTETNLTTNPNEADTAFKNIDIFDIPILFADNDGNTIDDNQTNNQVQKTIETNDTNDINSIDVVSEEIVDDAIGKCTI